jgi:phosphoglycolate phosphatase
VTDLTGKDSHPRLVIFDMDGTLVDVTKQHVEGHRVALRTVYGIEGEPDHRVHQGNTQPNILRMMCRREGVPSSVVETHLPRALQVLSDTTIALLDGDLRSCVLPGAVDLLDALVQGGHALALVTGCISSTALFVLERAGLLDYFPLCVFGDEGEERLDLLQLAVSRAVPAHKLGGNWDVPDGLAVIGDAPRDIQAGRALGARVVAVATGQHPLESLARYNPDALLPSLADRRAALGAILGSGADAGDDRLCPGIEDRG